MINRLQHVKPLVPPHPATAVAHATQPHDHGKLHQPEHGHGHFQGKHFRPGSGPARPVAPRARGPKSRISIKRPNNDDDNFDSYDPEENDLTAQEKSTKTSGEQKDDSQDSSDQQQKQQQRQAKWKIKAVAKSDSLEQISTGTAKATAPAALYRSFASAGAMQEHFASAALDAINNNKPGASIRSTVLPEMLATLQAIQKDKSLMKKTELSAIKEVLNKLSEPASPTNNSAAQDTYRRLLPLMLLRLGRRDTSASLNDSVSRLTRFINSLELTPHRTQTIAR
jgi:hypothetical protein